MRDELAKFKNEKDLVVMFTDSYDVHLFQTASQIVKKFKSMNTKVLFGAEYFCSPDKKKAEKFPSVRNEEKRFLNSGGYIGYVGDVYSVLSYLIDDLKIELPDHKKCVYLPDDAVEKIGLYFILDSCRLIFETSDLSKAIGCQHFSFSFG